MSYDRKDIQLKALCSAMVQTIIFDLTDLVDMHEKLTHQHIQLC